MRDVWNEGFGWQERVWRYLTAGRFAELLEHGRMYFAAATHFTDSFEGAVAAQHADFQIDPRYKEMDFHERAFKELKRLTKINCWHRADYESDAMWKLYAEQSKGVALTSTPERMQAAFKPFRLRDDYGSEDLWAGPVRYVDLLQVRMREGSMLNRFFYKHRAFEWEKEFRLAISVRLAEEFGVKVPELGIQVSVDLDALVESVVLGPALSKTEREMVIENARSAGLGNRLMKSSLLAHPRYL